MVGALTALWLALIIGAMLAAPPLLAVSGVGQRGIGNRLVVVDLRTNIQHPLTWRPTIAYDWEPNTGRAASVGGFDDGTALIYAPDGSVKVLEVYGARTLQWTPDGEQLVMLTPGLYNIGDPDSGEIVQRTTSPPLEISVFSLVPLSPTQMMIRASQFGAAVAYYGLDYETGSAEILTNLPCNNLPYIFDIDPISGQMVYICAPTDPVRVWDINTAQEVATLPMPAAPGSISSLKWALDTAHVLYEHSPSRRGNSGILTNHYLVNLEDESIQRLRLDDWTGVRWLPLKALGRGR
jgi:WD40 repeat protein